MEQELQELKQQLASLETLMTEKFLRLENMLEQRFGHFEESNLQHVNESLNRMNRHIDFIHETYATFETPLTYVKHKVERLISSSSASSSSSSSSASFSPGSSFLGWMLPSVPATSAAEASPLPTALPENHQPHQH